MNKVEKGSRTLFQVIVDEYYDWKEIFEAMFKRLIWRRFALALILVIGFGYGTVQFVTDSAVAFQKWDKEYQAKVFQEEVAKYDKVRVIISEGDTAWTIQQALTPHESDLRHSLYLSEELNKGADFGNLLPGQTLTFLKEKPHKN